MMGKDLMIYFDEDGVGKVYDDTYDITIHCESEEEQEKAIELIKSTQRKPDKEKISDALYHIYRNIGTNTSAEGVVAIKYYIGEIWHEIFGEDRPTWLT
jgi:hypothetical protein